MANGCSADWKTSSWFGWLLGEPSKFCIPSKFSSSPLHLQLILRSLIFSNMADDPNKQAAATAQQNVTINAVEAQFRIAHITSEETKYYHIISRLPAAVLIECENVVVESYQKDDLNKLKQALLDRYTLSTDQRIIIILNEQHKNKTKKIVHLKKLQ